PESVEPAVDLVDLITLAGKIIRAEAAGVGRGLAVIGHAEVLVSCRPTGERQLFDRVGAVGVTGVAVEKTLERFTLDEPGQRLPSGGGNLAHPFPQLRRDEAQAQRLVE